MFSTLKSYLIAAGAAIVVILLTLLNYFKAKAERMEHRVRVAEAGLKRKIEDDIHEAEVESEWSDRERIANENLDDIPEFLRKRRRVRDDTD